MVKTLLFGCGIGLCLSLAMGKSYGQETVSGGLLLPGLEHESAATATAKVGSEERGGMRLLDVAKIDGHALNVKLKIKKSYTIKGFSPHKWKDRVLVVELSSNRPGVGDYINPFYFSRREYDMRPNFGITFKDKESVNHFLALLENEKSKDLALDYFKLRYVGESGDDFIPVVIDARDVWLVESKENGIISKINFDELEKEKLASERALEINDSSRQLIPNEKSDSGTGPGSSSLGTESGLGSKSF